MAVFHGFFRDKTGRPCDDESFVLRLTRERGWPFEFRSSIRLGQAVRFDILMESLDGCREFVSRSFKSRERLAPLRL